MEVNSWPFIQAELILKKINNITPKKGFVLFETGYGPSGLPHIGTFAEVVRTEMVIKALNFLAPDIKTKLICFSDDMDGLRKIPDNIPKHEMLKSYIGRSLTDIPDPFDLEASYGDYMNKKLKKFLDRFHFKYEFYSSTLCYKKGLFNNSLKKIADNYKEIRDLIIRNVGKERAKNYSPFMPICPKSKKLLEFGVLDICNKEYLIEFLDSEGKKQVISILNGECKLQWKVDFAMRWHALEVDFEMYGKDLITSADLAQKINKILGGRNPVNFIYELFLDDKGQKISKSKGNGLSLDDWLKYAPAESLYYYLFLKPKAAKRLYFDIIPKVTDEYISYLTKYNNLDDEKKINTPIFFIHERDITSMTILSFSLLLNLASVCNPENDKILWGFISKYDKSLKKGVYKLFDDLVKFAITYYNDFVKITKKYRNPTDIEKKSILALRDLLKKNQSVTDAKILQNFIYDIGNKFSLDLQAWFKGLYEILLGQTTGPRMGSFISLFGVKKMILLIEKKLDVRSEKNIKINCYLFLLVEQKR